MSDRASTYVADLGRDRVTSAQKHVLSAIARHHSERYGTANLSLEDLAADVLRSKRQLGRIFKKLSHLLEYIPGMGSGNYSQFRFLELEKVTQRRHKGDIFDTAIRKNLNLKQDQKQKQHGFAGVTGGCDPMTAKAIHAWSEIKTKLQLSLETAEFSQWVRPTYVLRTMGDCIQLTHPPDGRITEKLRSSSELQRLVREAGYGGALFAGYPDDYELQKLAERFPEAYDQISPALKKRAESAA